jgi:hypothetical protein
MIRATDRVASVLARDLGLIDVFVAASPVFEKLRSTTMRRTMARLVTVEQAARIAGIDPSALVDHLNHAISGDAAKDEAFTEEDAAPAPEAEAIPAAVRALPADAIVECDVREDLRAGREPFRKILDGAMALPVGSVLRVRAIFEPVPLYAVLGKLGMAHYTEQLAPDDFRVWFHKDGASHAPAPDARAASDAPVEPEDGHVIVLDVRGLEPPEPMVRTLETLATMPRGKTLVQLNVRVPQFLLPKLEERGFTYEIKEQSADLVRLFIRHKEP